jgi:transcriptional antiterminator NusG
VSEPDPTTDLEQASELTDDASAPDAEDVSLAADGGLADDVTVADASADGAATEDAVTADAATDEATEAGEDEDTEDKAAEEELDVDPVEEFMRQLRAQPGDWYVIHSYAGYENRVKTNLENRIGSLNMEDFIFQIEVPVHNVTEIKQGKRQQVSEKATSWSGWS